MCVCVGVDVKGAVGGKNHTHTQSHHTFKCASGAREDKTGEYDIMNNVMKEACSMYVSLVRNLWEASSSIIL